MSTLTIALDMMGGDVGPPVIFMAAVRAARQYPQVSFLLYGRESDIHPLFLRHQKSITDDIRNRLIVMHCDDAVSMAESPTAVLRSKKDTSMRRMIEAVKDGRANGCVSAGNTGALMSLAYYLIKTHSGIDRPALVSAMPTTSRHRVFLLDLGANVTCTAETLFQYGVMGTVLAQQVAHIDKPRVALLNVGEEEIKGNAQVKLADAMFRQAKSINYIGYVEGTEIFSDSADVIVTDGFTGNIALKSSEGLAKLIVNEVKLQSQRNILTRLMAKAAMPLLKQIYNRVNPDQYNGASLIGLRSTVIKSHGNATADAFYYAIQLAIQEAQMHVPEKIKTSIETVLLEQL